MTRVEGAEDRMLWVVLDAALRAMLLKVEVGKNTSLRSSELSEDVLGEASLRDACLQTVHVGLREVVILVGREKVNLPLVLVFVVVELLEHPIHLRCAGRDSFPTFASSRTRKSSDENLPRLLLPMP